MTETVLPRRRRMRHALALPNLLTYGRLAAVPVVALLLQWPNEFWMRWTALAVFTVACITDFFDGYLARIWKQQSPLGQMLDPIADKLLVATTLLAVAANQTLSGWTIWAAIIILCREFLVSGFREYLADLKVPLPVSAVAKWKTTVQMFALDFHRRPGGGDCAARHGGHWFRAAVDRRGADALHRSGLSYGGLAPFWG